MKRILIYLLLVMSALPIAGLFGAIHDQVSFTVSPEYFTKFKFIQFGMTHSEIPARLRASEIGFLASWWMGLPIGVLGSGLAFLHRAPKRMLRFGLWSYLVLMGFAGAVALIGLAYGFYATQHIDLREYHGWYIPSDVMNLRAFLCAGYMHNAAYIGGALGIVTAWVFHIITKVRYEV